nr:MAG TPA: hypothetical protein [Caudoviricetes sp.]
MPATVPAHFPPRRRGFLHIGNSPDGECYSLLCASCNPYLER